MTEVSKEMQACIDEAHRDMKARGERVKEAERLAAARPTRLALLEMVNDLNIRAATNRTGKLYWTVTVLYNTVIYERDQDGFDAIHEVIEGVPK